MLKILILGAIRVYQQAFRPWMRPACRFAPTCSCYAEEAVATHGAWRGLGLTLRRLAKCRPGGGSGWDPVPQQEER